MSPVITCPSCNGERSIRCPDCGGSGEDVSIPESIFSSMLGHATGDACITCHRRKTIICPACHATGYITVDKKDNDVLTKTRCWVYRVVSKDDLLLRGHRVIDGSLDKTQPEYLGPLEVGLNELGSDGWELVSVQNDMHYFRRAI